MRERMRERSLWRGIFLKAPHFASRQLILPYLEVGNSPIREITLLRADSRANVLNASPPSSFFSPKHLMGIYLLAMVLFVCLFIVFSSHRAQINVTAQRLSLSLFFFFFFFL